MKTQPANYRTFHFRGTLERLPVLVSPLQHCKSKLYVEDMVPVVVADLFSIIVHDKNMTNWIFKT